MCLAMPVEVITIDGETGKVNLGGVHKEISFALVEDVEVGDFVLIHVGYALNKVSPEEAEHTLALFAEAGLETGR
ncbi:MAG: HypC/HybG/HupF family hydrogenase formation chaperone [Candidatus Polarisedimenticolaceae bacterium]|nr:HypC/HybG/HupF family hydrogenase formation chaperone [Candidatus Polarisedimenticolaceae bacterium]